MMACELAAHRPERVSKMIVLDPIGLWRDDVPVARAMTLPDPVRGISATKRFCDR
jgi:pimeloyl-ACP methyl ester carboxylesterase